MFGFMEGMARELYELARPILTDGSFCLKNLVASGNGVRKNSTMRSILSNRFCLPVRVPILNEEAAYGAALFAMTAVGRFSDFDEVNQFIKYYN